MSAWCGAFPSPPRPPAVPFFARMQKQAASVYIQEELVDYIVSLVTATRDHPMILRGASPRATLSLTSMAKAVAFMQGRDYVVPKDIQNIFVETVSHRLLLSTQADAQGVRASVLLGGILEKTPAPKV